jgi:excisionase family DNA binding protein
MTTASGRRSHIELVYEILALCEKESPKRTRIMYQVRLSYAQLQQYLSLLSENGLIYVDGAHHHHLTEEGRQSFKRVSRPVRAIRKFQEELANGRIRTTALGVNQSPGFDFQSVPALLSVSQVAHILGTHAHSVRRWSDTGILPSHRFGERGDRKFERKDVDKFLLSQAHKRPRRPETKRKLG